ncbi:restriction endonuclease [Actinosynnema sp. NPDC023658]|uniref:restriction endonuclease n=1 Tax=Actinosynnema sp. NPDC023658 TaxID=3155465 RepID=UPI0033C8A42C
MAARARSRRRSRGRGNRRRKRVEKRIQWSLLLGGAAVFLLWRFVEAHPVLSVWVASVLVGTTVVAFAVWLRARHHRSLLQAERDLAIGGTDGMSGAEFEQWTARLLRRSGCVDVRVVGGAGDAGADVVAKAPDGRRVVVQCKRYSNNVGTKAVQLFAGTDRLYHKADVSLLVTTAGFTADARKVAAGVGILLVDRPALAEWARTGTPPFSMTRPTPQRGRAGVQGSRSSVEP